MARCQYKLTGWDIMQVKDGMVLRCAGTLKSGPGPGPVEQIRHPLSYIAEKRR